MPVKGAARLDARAAVRNSASRRVIDPVICVLKMRPLALARRYDAPHRNTGKTGTNQLACFASSTTLGYHLSSDSHPIQRKHKMDLNPIAQLCLALLLFGATLRS